MTENTPLAKIDHEQMKLYAKLEHSNIMGSLKDCTGFLIQNDGVENGEIHQEAFVKELFIGNFSVSLTCMCHFLSLKYVAIFHPGINRVYKPPICRFAFEVVVVDNLETNASLLPTNIEAIRQFLLISLNSFRTIRKSNENDGPLPWDRVPGPSWLPGLQNRSL